VNLSDILDAIGFLRGMTGNEYLANRWTFKRPGDSTLYTFENLCINFNIFFADITRELAKTNAGRTAGNTSIGYDYLSVTGTMYVGQAIKFSGHSTIYHVSSFNGSFIILYEALTADIVTGEDINYAYCERSWYRFKGNDEAAGIIREIAAGQGLFGQVKYDPSNERMRMVFQHRNDPDADEIVLTKRKKSTPGSEWNNLFNQFDVTYPLSQTLGKQIIELPNGVTAKSYTIDCPFFAKNYAAAENSGVNYKLMINDAGTIYEIDKYCYLFADGATIEYSWLRDALYALYADLWSVGVIRETKEETYKGMGAEVDGDDKIAYMALANYVMDNNPGGVLTRYYIISLSRNPFTNEKRIKRVQLK
jgi:hypothetical protein